MIVLEGKSLAKRYEQQSTVILALRGVDFRLESGEILGVAGESGSGKSTDHDGGHLQPSGPRHAL